MPARPATLNESERLVGVDTEPLLVTAVKEERVFSPRDHRERSLANKILIQDKSAASNSACPSAARSREAKVGDIAISKVHEVRLLPDDCRAGSRHGVDRVTEVPRSVVVVVIELGDDPSASRCSSNVEALPEAQIRRCEEGRAAHIFDDGLDFGSVEFVTVTDDDELAVNASLSFDGVNHVT